MKSKTEEGGRKINEGRKKSQIMIRNEIKRARVVNKKDNQIMQQT